MKITKLKIDIETSSPHDDHLKPKSILMNDNVWELPEMFPRDIQFVAALAELINVYNRGK